MLSYTPTSVVAGYNANQINTNFTNIQTAIAEGLSRSDNTDNAMEVDLDLGTNDIINVGSITVATDLTVGGVSIATQVANAAASAAAASVSEGNAGTSESNAAISESNASGSATLASQWATLTGGLVAATDYSAKEWAIGTTVATGSSKDWATITGGFVDGAEYSAKEYAIGTTVAVGSAKDWATITGADVDGADYSAKEYAIGTFVPAGSAKQWATEAEDVLVNATEYSAFHWAQKAAAASGGDTVKVSANDTTVGYLTDKLVVTNGLTATELTDGGDEDLRIGVGAKLSIGTTTEGDELHVHAADTGACYANFTNITTGAGIGLGFRVGLNAAENGEIIARHSGSELRFGANDTFWLTILSDGSMKHGTTSSLISSRFHLHDTGGTEEMYIHFTDNNTGTAATDGFRVGIDNATSAGRIHQYENAAIEVYNNNALTWVFAADGGLYSAGVTGTSKGADTINVDGGYYVDGNKVVAAQQSAIASLTDSTGGTDDGTLSAVSGSGDDATINNNFSELHTKQDAILAALRAHGLIAT